MTSTYGLYAYNMVLKNEEMESKAHSLSHTHKYCAN